MLLGTDISRHYNATSAVDIDGMETDIAGFNATMDKTNSHISMDIYKTDLFMPHRDQAVKDFAEFIKSVLDDNES